MVKIELKEAGYLFEESYQKKYGNVFLLPSQETIIFELEGSFISPDDFQKLFLKAEKITTHNIISKIIIDMRSVEGFHQPSFEWLLLIWKANMLEKGIKNYAYLLRDEAWFEELVRLTFRKVVKNNPQTVLEQLEIRYCKSFYEAVS
jgi:ribonucleotide reductase beta subunit family protein with ferritin-like domain